MSTKYAFLSLPQGVFDSSDRDDAISSLRGTISSDNGSVLPFNIPDFKIGTLDALVQQADELTKLEASCQAVVSKVADSLKNVLEGDEDRIAQYKMVNDKPTDHAAKPSNSGNLTTKSLTPIVDPKILVQDSEYIETHLIVVPNNAKKDFIKEYETIAPMVVPRSAIEVTKDDEFVLFAVATFKKHSTEFLVKCREHKWTPRQYKYVEGGRQEEQRELDRVTNEERKVCGEALRMGRTGWSESVMIWIHVMSLRVFVEAVLRYGLPLDYVSVLVKTTSKLAPKVKTALDSNYSFLGGNAFGRDKRGKITKDDAALSSEMAAAGFQTGEGHEYTAYVYYEMEFP
ncbi:V-ATPase subunit C [Fusarium beomiforme]|uniref:V-type proton ATPase subunit C n=1 Tax=Fusarium beomiforme TaxID=44412 RepID=A0A9P5DUT7_9HYPO|nr:V-ATPase subunit C [Fusarium beomiforme]